MDAKLFDMSNINPFHSNPVKSGTVSMYLFDVSYSVDGNNFSKSFLLAESRDGFELQQQLQTLLEQEHVAPVYMMETDLEEL